MTGIARVRPRRRGVIGIRWATVLVACLLGIASAWAPAWADVPYRVTFEGLKDGKLRTLIESVSSLKALQKKPPASALGLQRRADGDQKRFLRALRSRGYFDASVAVRIDASATPAKVVVTATPGTRYRIGAYEVQFASRPPKGLDVSPASLKLKAGTAASSAPIIAAEKTIVARLARRGHPLAKVLGRKALANRATKRLSVTVRVDPGPAAKFGAVRVIGLTSVNPSVVRGRLAWTRGQSFDPRKIDQTRDDLIGQRLFASVRITPATAVEASGELPITITVVEAKHRTIAAGARYSTSEGPGGQVYWEHRNLLGRAERFRIEGRGSFIEHGLGVEFDRPLFLRPDQDLKTRAFFKRDTTDAFRSRIFGGDVGVIRRLDRFHLVGVGVSFERSRITDEGDIEDFTLFGLPLRFERTTANDVLDPTTGERIRATLTPYVDPLRGGLAFTVGRVDGSLYRPITKNERVIAALRASYGSIVGAGLRDIPSNKRFFSGGGGSVRGFGFQKAGELDVENDPIGGRSVIEVGAELRIRIGKRFGVVPFIEGGRAFRGPIPDFKKGLFWAGGLGVRYFTDFGPLRVDFAVPINRRSADDRFQFYISIGQAF